MFCLRMADEQFVWVAAAAAAAGHARFAAGGARARRYRRRAAPHEAPPVFRSRRRYLLARGIGEEPKCACSRSALCKQACEFACFL